MYRSQEKKTLAHTTKTTQVIEIMNKVEYKAYIQSSHWVKLKRDKKNSAPGKCPRCAVCFGWKYLSLHHVNYDRLGKELPSDTVWLCMDCHGWIHRMAVQRNTKPDYNFVVRMSKQFNAGRLRKIKPRRH